MRRKSIRLPEFDYSQPGAYFVTICCRDKTPVFDNKLFATEAWRYLKNQFITNDGDIDAVVLLPDHIHFILRFIERSEQTLGKRVKEIKIGIWLSIRNAGFDGKRMWQRNYYEHIIRHEKDWYEKVNYMRNTPVNKGLVESVDEWEYFWVSSQE